MAVYLVTGGAGFIGSNIVKRLVDDGEKVKVVDDLSTGRLENIKPLLKKIDFIEESVNNTEGLRRVLTGVDYVLHQAAIPSVARSVEDPLKTNEANVTGTLSLLVAAKDTGVKCIVCASSSSVYGGTEQLPKCENMSPMPLSPYAVSKLAGEYYSQVFSRLYNINAVMIRYFNVFGPNQNPESQYAAVIPKFIQSMLKGERPVIYGDGKQSRDFTFVENVVKANLLACGKKSGTKGAVMNVACGNRYSLIELVDSLNEILGTSLEPEFKEARPGDVKHSQADISLAEKLIGYKPEVDFKEGLRRTVKWYRENRK